MEQPAVDLSLFGPREHFLRKIDTSNLTDAATD
jgi:hypothetical protein